ncbi:N-acetylglucosaminyldiphosphodolichol N-acetylglucosaminyltransferase catalytic subunit alg13 [Mortierella sp. AM989]|nr:N-acetylglucosaminyldiphosphodolichol N-acetylglucosaminyltransferase catalytic subunit alg13 [Mortierella sp. AM989]
MANSVFVTVGSTRFDRLVNATSSPALQQLLLSLNYTHLTIQHGQSPIQALSESSSTTQMQVDTYPYKPTLKEDMERSGSILEALRLRKKLIVVVNEDLMDNHQLELGSALGEQGYLVSCTVAELENTIKARKYESLIPFPEADTTRFAEYLDQHLGFE